MNDLEIVIAAAKTWALEELQKYNVEEVIPLFDIANSEGQTIARKQSVDADIVMLGTVLMDVKLGQALRENKLSEHVAMGVQAAKEFLEGHKVSPDVKDKVLNCIGAHHGTIPYSCEEAEVCSNADCYKFITPKGQFYYLQMNLERGMSLAEALNQSYTKLEEKHAILSLPECKEELESHYQHFKALFDAAGAKLAGKG